MTNKVLQQKNKLRAKRKLRVRGSIFGTSSKPRLSVFRSNRYLYAQAIDDQNGTTLASVDGKKLGFGNNKARVSAPGIWHVRRVLVDTSLSERAQSCQDGHPDILSIFRSFLRCLSGRKNDLKISNRDMSYLLCFLFPSQKN